MIARGLNLDNLKAKDFTANVDFSNVKVEMIGGLPTFSCNTKSKVQYCDCCGVELTEDNNKCGYCICDKCNEELERYCKHIKDSCEVTGIYADKRSGLTIKKIN